MTITETILHLRKQYFKKYHQDPRQINQGNCDSFAQDLLDKFPSGVTMWGEDVPARFRTKAARDATKQYYHCFFFLDGLYYDSECPEGVSCPDEIPFYKRATKNFY